MHQAEYRRIERLENKHFWYRAMEEASLDLIRRYTYSKKLSILDAGCGTGGMTEKLGVFGKTKGVDINPKALSLAKNKVIAKVQRADICRLPFGNNSFDLITSFDVLYHKGVSNDTKALSEFYRVLKKGGVLLIRVPAFEHLRGSHDVTVQTRHRYTLGELQRKLVEAGFTIRELSYANMILSFPLFIKRFVERHLIPGKQHSDTQPLPLPVNELFYWILRLENELSRFITLPYGSSVVAVVQKPSQKHPSHCHNVKDT